MWVKSFHRAGSFPRGGNRIIACLELLPPIQTQFNKDFSSTYYVLMCETQSCLHEAQSKLASSTR